jgi:hypothetical protein
MKKILFSPGQILITPAALELLSANNVQPMDLLLRHLSGDWGELSPSDRAENDFSLIHGYRILSAYTVKSSKVWLITENDRSATTFLLPSDY